MNMQITDAYILDMNKDELRNFLYYNLDCSSFNNISEKTKLYCVLENPYSVVYMNNPSDDCLGRAIYLQPLIIWFYKNNPYQLLPVGKQIVFCIFSLADSVCQSTS